jgi:hypothetical protein
MYSDGGIPLPGHAVRVRYEKSEPLRFGTVGPAGLPFCVDFQFDRGMVIAMPNPKSVCFVPAQTTTEVVR